MSEREREKKKNHRNDISYLQFRFHRYNLTDSHMVSAFPRAHHQVSSRQRLRHRGTVFRLAGLFFLFVQRVNLLIFDLLEEEKTIPGG